MLSVLWIILQDNPELDAIWRLLQYFWNKHYQGIWQALQGYQWSQQVCWRAAGWHAQGLLQCSISVCHCITTSVKQMA